MFQGEIFDYMLHFLQLKILAISDVAILEEIGHFQACRKWSKSKNRTDVSASNHPGGPQQCSR